jgi:hypothetical protein
MMIIAVDRGDIPAAGSHFSMAQQSSGQEKPWAGAISMGMFSRG